MAAAKFKPVYILHGTDEFLRDQHRHRIIDLMVGQSDPQLCVATFDATAQLADVLDELRTLPFLAPCRVVIVRDADAFVTAFRTKLEDYLQSPCRTSSLVLIVSSWPRTTRLAKLVSKTGEVLECSVAERTNLPAWLAEAARRRDKAIAPDAAGLLGEWMGADFAALDSEIEKLSIYVGERETIELADVVALVTATAGPVAFALTNAIAAGDAAAALKALDGMLTKPGEEFRTLGLLAWHLRRAIRAHQSIQSGQRPQQAVAALGMPYPAQQSFLAFLRRRGRESLQADFRQMIAADLGMKSGAAPKAALQGLIVALCS